MIRILLVSLVIACISSCGNPDHPTKKDPAKILSTPPFASLTDSINRFPDDPELYFRRARLLSHNNFQSMATEDYKKSWELSQDEGVALEYVSNLVMTDQTRAAERFLQQAMEKFPQNTEFGRRLAEIYVQENQPLMAQEEYKKILEQDSSNFEAWYEKGQFLLKMKDTPSATKALEKSFAIMPINYSGIALANIYTAKKDPRALQICNQLIAQDSSGLQTDPVFTKGVYYSEIKDYDKAIEQFDLCIKRDWKFSDAYIEKGIAFYETKNYSQALKTLKLAITVSNTDADAYYWLGRCQEATGDLSAAKLNYQRAFSLDNSFSEALQALRRLKR